MQHAYEGLTSAEAANRLAADGPNEIPSSRPRRLWRQVRDVVLQPMLALLLGAAVINFVVAELLDAVVLGMFVVVVVAITVVQSHRAERALYALRELSSPRALVIRDGERIRIAGADVVRGDLLVVSEGDRIAADAVLVTSLQCAVDESLLTGESIPVAKSAITQYQGDEQMGAPGGVENPWVFSGTLVVRGQGLAVVLQTGSHTAMGRIGAALESIDVEETQLQREVRRIVRIIAILGLAAAAAVVILYAVTRNDWVGALLAGIAAAMALLPEEFPVVLTLFLTMGAWHMTRHNVLTRATPAIEALGAVTVLCVDKTGTLTMNRMSVRELFVEDVRYVPDDEPLPHTFLDLANAAALASPESPFDPMDRAFREFEERYLADASRRFDGWALERVYPLSERLMALANVWRSPDGSVRLVAIKGAPEAIAELCAFTAERREALVQQVASATENGQRVLAIAWAECKGDASLPADVRAFSFTYLGLAGLHDPVRPGVADAVAACARAGVRTVMITGDFPGTAMAIAREIGIAHDSYLTGSDLAGMTDAELAVQTNHVSVYARMVPEQKLRLVRALQADGAVVGMTGDGVNDAPALRAADIGIAMGGRGTDVAREAAALVITDDDFASIAMGVRLGRGIYANLQKAMTYIIAVHVPIFGMALVPVLVPHWPLVLMPMQIAIMELIIDPACSIVFEAEEVDAAILEQPPRRPDAPLFDRSMIRAAVAQGFALLGAVLGVYWWTLFQGRADAEVRSTAFITLVVGNVLLILVNRSHRLTILQTVRVRRNTALPWILGGVVAGLFVVQWIAPIRDALRLSMVRPADAGVAVGAALLAVTAFEIRKVLRARD